jgi:leucyl aminopeptidase
MTLELKLAKSVVKGKPTYFALFLDNSFNLGEFTDPDLKKNLDLFKKTSKFIRTEKKDFEILTIRSEKKVLLINYLSNKNNKEKEIKFGAKFYDYLKLNDISLINFDAKNISSLSNTTINYFDNFIHGIELKAFCFDKYKNKKNKTLKINLISKKNKIFNINKKSKLKSLVQGVNFTKELVSEPGNILHPDEYVRRINELKKIGLRINVYDKKKLKKMGMNALLGVGQGSVRGSYLVTLEWKGSNKKQQPMAFVGKGVCFDTGGISLKPAKFMEDMTYDMAGSAVVVGLMKTLALRKAKVNVVGVVGLVENMPDGNAQRPGDIVKSFSGKTIEILNTDAEGRLVLADAITYTEKKFKPKFIVDLATLTGAIIVSLGSEYAGLFSNDDKISDQLFKAGEKVGEKVWRMPLNDNYDKLIDSKKADMQNINYVGGAGSTTAAQFLQRFIINKTPWVHLDIAGMAFSKYGGALNSEGATGYGVRLLNQLIEDNYE